MGRWAMAAFEMPMPLALVTAIEMRVVRQGKTLPRLRRRLASLNAIKVANHNEVSHERRMKENRFSQRLLCELLSFEKMFVVVCCK
mgnify:CR=1 FL=1